MLMFRFIVAPLAVAATLVSASGLAEANCGLDYCPLPEDEASKLELGSVQLMVRHVEFSLPEGNGSYLENLVRVDVQRFANWNFGAWIAPTMLTVNEETRTGLSNPVLFAERRQPIGNRWRLLAGLQLEVPMGDSHNGIASGHTELLSYVGAAIDTDALRLQVQGGLATALSKGHGHSGSNAIFVNPHEDREAQVRATLVAPLLNGRLQPMALFNGRVVVEDVEDRMFLTGAFGASYQITGNVRFTGQIEVPLTEAQRFDWRAGMGIGFAL